MTKLFITGATGYIGGDALYAIANAHPEYEITCLVRNSDKGAQVVKDYPKIKLVYGDLDSVDLLEAEAAKADVVCNCANTDHEPSINALIKGLLARTAPRPGFLIHNSGGGTLFFNDMRTQTYGEAPKDKIYNDLEGIHEVTSLPDDAPHREVDKTVLAAGTEHSERLKTAIVCAPCIYGVGRGPGNRRSVQIPELVRNTLVKGHGLQVGAGKAVIGNVHVRDLSELYLLLVKEAAAGGATADWEGKPAVWGGEGYYFCENGEEVWGDVAKLVAVETKKQGFIKTDEVRSVSKEEADELCHWGGVLWGCNSRSRAKRAREVLKWTPKEVSLRDEIPATVEMEAKKLEIVPGHAKVAAGDA